VLAVPEFVGNAAQHGIPPVSLALLRHRQAVLLKVRDEGVHSHSQAVTGRDDDDESGCGLLIVDAWAGDVGVRDISGDCKVAWAALPVDESTPDEGQVAGRALFDGVAAWGSRPGGPAVENL